MIAIAGDLENVRALVTQLAAACGLSVVDDERRALDHELACGSSSVGVVWP